MAGKSPTSRTIEVLKRSGYHPEIVERWNPWSKTRRDMYGVIDVLAVRRGETLAVQTTTMSNRSKQINKMLAAPGTIWMLDAGWKVEVWAWVLRKGRWALRVTRLVLLENGEMEAIHEET